MLVIEYLIRQLKCFSSLIDLLTTHLCFEFNLLVLIGMELTMIRFQTVMVVLLLIFVGVTHFLELITIMLIGVILFLKIAKLIEVKQSPKFTLAKRLLKLIKITLLLKIKLVR